MIRSVMRLIIALQCLSAIVNASYFGRFDRLSTFRNSTATTDLQWRHEGSISANLPWFPQWAAIRDGFTADIGSGVLLGAQVGSTDGSTFLSLKEGEAWRYSRDSFPDPLLVDYTCAHP